MMTNTAMTAATRAIAATTPAPAPRSLRLALAVAAPVFAVSVAVTTLTTRYRGPAAMIEQATSEPAFTTMLGTLHLLIVITLVPGVLVAGLAALRRAPRLASVALLVAVPGWAASLAMPDAEWLAREMVGAGVSQPAALAVLEPLSGFTSTESAIAVVVFVVGHVLGTLLLGAALVRARAVPVVIGVLFALSQVLHFVAFVILANPWLDAGSYALTALGLGAAGWAYYRRG